MEAKGEDRFAKRVKRLESLEVAIALLLGSSVVSAPRLIDVLPSSLRQLSLRDDLLYIKGYEWREKPLLDNIREVVAHRRQGTSRLELLELLLNTPVMTGR